MKTEHEVVQLPLPFEKAFRKKRKRLVERRARYVIFKDAMGWTWLLLSSNGRAIATSVQHFTSVEMVYRGLKRIEARLRLQPLSEVRQNGRDA